MISRVRKLRHWWQSECAGEGCTARPVNRWIDFCTEHYIARLRASTADIERRHAAAEQAEAITVADFANPNGTPAWSTDLPEPF